MFPKILGFTVIGVGTVIWFWGLITLPLIISVPILGFFAWGCYKVIREVAWRSGESR